MVLAAARQWKRPNRAFAVMMIIMYFLFQLAITVSAATPAKIKNDFESLSVVKREHVMFQTYNAKLAFIGEAYADKKIKLAFRVTGATSRLSFMYRVVFSDGTTNSNGLLLSPEIRYYKGQTVHIYTIANESNKKMVRFDYTIDANNELYKSGKKYEKTYTFNNSEKQKVFIPAVLGTQEYSIKTNYAVKTADRNVTINRISLEKASKPLSPNPQSVNIFEGGTSDNIGYVLTIFATTTSLLDDEEYSPYGSINFASVYATSYMGGNNNPWSNSYRTPIGIFAGVPVANKYVFNLTKSLQNLDTVANVEIDGAYFALDLKNGLRAAKPSPHYASVDTNSFQWTPVKDYYGIWRVNAIEIGNSGTDEDEFEEQIKFHEGIKLHKMFKTLSFTASFTKGYNSDYSTTSLQYLADGYINIYKTNEMELGDQYVSEIPQKGLIKSIHLTADSKPQDVTVDVTGLDNVQIVYYVKNTGSLGSYKSIPALLLCDLYVK